MPPFVAIYWVPILPYSRRPSYLIDTPFQLAFWDMRGPQWAENDQEFRTHCLLRMLLVNALRSTRCPFRCRVPRFPFLTRFLPFPFLRHVQTLPHAASDFFRKNQRLLVGAQPCTAVFLFPPFPPLNLNHHCMPRYLLPDFAFLFQLAALETASEFGIRT